MADLDEFGPFGFRVLYSSRKSCLTIEGVVDGARPLTKAKEKQNTRHPAVG